MRHSEPGGPPAPATVQDGLRVLLEEYSPSCLVADAGAGVISGLEFVDRNHKVVGPAATIQLDADELVDCLPALERFAPGDVIVIACTGEMREAVWGGLMSSFAQLGGMRGVVVDGLIRDVDELRDLNFPAWFRGVHPRRCGGAPSSESSKFRVNSPVVVAGVPIAPGDYIIADENGVAAVAAANLQRTLDDVQQMIDKETRVREVIAGGASLREILRTFGAI